MFVTEFQVYGNTFENLDAIGKQATGLGHCILKNSQILQLFVTFIILLFNTVLPFQLSSSVLMDLISLLDVGLVNC